MPPKCKFNFLQTFPFPFSLMSPVERIVDLIRRTKCQTEENKEDLLFFPPRGKLKNLFLSSVIEKECCYICRKTFSGEKYGREIFSSVGSKTTRSSKSNQNNKSTTYYSLQYHYVPKHQATSGKR